jgi:uncharacterized phage-associated protein
MTALHFKPEKLVHSLVFFSNAGVSDLTKLKAAKLLYFADKEHLLRYGRPILGDVYFCLPFGPVPSVALNEMGNAIEKSEVEDSDRNLMRNYLDVKKGFWHKYSFFKAKRKYDPDVFSESEIEVLNHVVKVHGKQSARKLVDLTHDDPTWSIPNQWRISGGRARIPYDLFFAGASPDAQRMLELFRMECSEASDLDAFLSVKPPQAMANA